MGSLHKALHDIGHTFHRFMSKNIGNDRNLSPTEELHSFLFYDNLKHLLCLVPAKLFLRKEEHTDSVVSLSAKADVKSLRLLGKKLMGYLKQDSNAVSGLSLRILSGTVFQILNNL